MSTTPRTDEEALRIIVGLRAPDLYAIQHVSESSGMYVQASFARQLERELAAARTEISELQITVCKELEAKEGEKARVRELEEMLVAQQPDIDALVKSEGRLFKANADLRAQLARKDEALRPFAEKAERIMTKNEHYGLSQYVSDEIMYAVSFGDLRRAAAALETEVGK